MRAVRARLDALADSHPELTAANLSEANAGAWVTILEGGDDMAKDVKERVAEHRARRKAQGEAQLEVWLPRDVIERLDELAQDFDGNRSQAIAEAIRRYQPRRRRKARKGLKPI